MKNIALLSLFATTIISYGYSAEGGICHKCDEIREYNAKHHKDYEYYEDYQRACTSSCSAPIEIQPEVSTKPAVVPAEGAKSATPAKAPVAPNTTAPTAPKAAAPAAATPAAPAAATPAAPAAAKPTAPAAATPAAPKGPTSQR